jgi:hypothetical protein
MRLNLVRCTLLLLFAGTFAFEAPPVFSQQSDPLAIGVPVTIFRRAKPTRRSSPKSKPVERAPLLKLEWRLYKVNADGSEQETEQETFKRGDRLRLAVRTNQDGYLYVIHQRSSTSPGEVVFPDSKVNNGSSSVYRSEEFVLPSNCPVKISRRDCALILTSSAGEEIIYLFFSRDPFTDLPGSAYDATESISPETLEKLVNDSSEKDLKPQKGSTPFSELLVNMNTRDNEEIVKKVMLGKRP